MTQSHNQSELLINLKIAHLTFRAIFCKVQEHIYVFVTITSGIPLEHTLL